MGRSVTLGDRAYTVVGVMPAGYVYPTWADLWAPITTILSTDAALGQRPFAAATGPGQQAQPAHRPAADTRQCIELRDPRGPGRTGRGRRARCGAPEAGLEHRNGLLETIWHLKQPQRRDDDNRRDIRPPPGTQEQIAEAGQMLSNKCSVVKREARPRSCLARLLQTDAEHRLEVVLRVDLEGDVRVGLGDPGDLREL